MMTANNRVPRTITFLDDEQKKARATFLVAMYNQLMGDINRHIVVVWQSVTTLVGAFAAWSLIEKNIISLDFAVTLIILIATWVVAHVYDASYWYNRNLVMIANIERQFLVQGDLQEIHYYWAAHRAPAEMITHLKLQLSLAVGLALFVFGIHSFKTFFPFTAKAFAAASIAAYLPLAAITVGIFVWAISCRKHRTRYETFIENSPGRSVDGSSINHGPGHPVKL